MRKTLVVSDNEFINLLYVLNLEVYLAAETVLVTNIPAAIEQLNSKNHFELIVTLETVDKGPASTALSAHLNSYGLKIPMLVTGTSKDEVIRDNVYGVSGKFNIQNVLKLLHMSGVNLLTTPIQFLLFSS